MPKICVLGFRRGSLYLSTRNLTLEKGVLREPSVVDLLAVSVNCFPLARKLAVRGAREKAARLYVGELSSVVGGLPPGRRP